MLTQDQICEPDGKPFPVKNRPIQIMDPTPGNGWGCIPAVDLIRMLRALAQEQGKPVEVVEAQPKTEYRKLRLFGKTVLILGSLMMVIHLIIYWVRP